MLSPRPFSSDRDPESIHRFVAKTLMAAKELLDENQPEGSPKCFPLLKGLAEATSAVLAATNFHEKAVRYFFDEIAKRMLEDSA